MLFEGEICLGRGLAVYFSMLIVYVWKGGGVLLYDLWDGILLPVGCSCPMMVPLPRALVSALEHNKTLAKPVCVLAHYIGTQGETAGAC